MLVPNPKQDAKNRADGYLHHFQTICKMMFEENRDGNLKKNGKSLAKINLWSTVPSKLLASAYLPK